MPIKNKTFFAWFGLLCATALTPLPASPQDIASLSPSSLRDTCVSTTDRDPSHIEIACTEALKSGFLDDRARAASFNRRAQAFADLGNRAKANDDYRDALAILDKLIDGDVAEPADLFQRAAALQGLGKLERAMADYNAIILRDPAAVDSMLQRGILMSNAGKWGQALADFDAVLMARPDHAVAYMERGNAYGQTGEYARALADLNKAIELAPDASQAYVFRGVLYGRQKKNQRALVDYNKALELNPRNADALTDRAAIYGLNGDYARSIADLTTAMSLNDGDNDALAHYNRGVAFFAINQFDKALSDYTAAIQLDRKMDVAWGNRCLARVLVAKDKDAQSAAVEDCNTAIELNPNGQNLYNVRGFVNLKLGHYDLALADYNTALKLDANSPHALYGRGLARLKRGEADGERDRAAAQAAHPGIDKAFSVFGVN